MEEFYYGQIVEYVDSSRDLNFEEAKRWCSVNNADFVEIGHKESEDNSIIRLFQITPFTKAGMEQTRQEAYKIEVDPIMAEYTRKKTFNLFEEGEEEALLAEIETKVEEIKSRYPYPESAEPVVEPEVVELYSMEI